MADRGRIATYLTLIVCSMLPLPAMAQDDRGVHDMSYTSPTWGYHVRWYSDEWTVNQERSEGRVDSLWLSDAHGSVVGFEGGSGYGGDAASCLEDLYSSVQAIPSAADIEVISDEEGTVQVSQDPWWSWTILLVNLTVGEQHIDHVIYLDCRTLVPGKAVLKRTLATPAATFYEYFDTPSGTFGHFDVLQASLPRSAWIVDPEYGYLMVGETGTNTQSVFYDQSCGAFPHGGKVAFGSDGEERAMLTVVDGPGDMWALDERNGTPRIVLIENISQQPLRIGPNEFVYVDGFPGNDDTRDIASPELVWEDSGESGERILDPGELAIARVTWPGGVTMPEFGVYLVYRDSASAAESTVDSIGIAGGCGGGSRPKLRLSR